MTEHPEPKNHAALICDALGRKEIAARVGVGITSVSNCSTEGRFPARWFLAVRAMCEEAGIECPLEAFNFIAGNKRREGDPPVQAGAA